MRRGGLAKLVAIILFGMTTICYSAEPSIVNKPSFHKTPLYKYMMEKYGTIPKAQKSPEPKKQTAEKKPLPKPSFKLEDELIDKTIPSPTYRQACELTSAYKQLNEIVDLSDLTPDTPFSEAINILRDLTKPKLNVLVFWRDLEENAGVYRDTPIGIDGISRIPLYTGLKLLLKSISTTGLEELGYVVDENLITIATKGSLPDPMFTEVYDVSVFSGAPADFYSHLMSVQFLGGGGGGSGGRGRGSGGGSGGGSGR